MLKPLELNDKFLNGKTIAVAVSGGRDSMALLHLFKNSQLNFFVVNIEHGIRGESSINDSLFVENFCNANNIKFESFKVNSIEYANQQHMTLEQSARELRFQVFNKLLDSNKCDFIALAHHLDDQSETILMRILRGTGLKGLKGIETVRDKFIRPLLNFSRADIDDYILKNQIPYIEDNTNSETFANRNFLRHEIFPLIQTRYPAYRESFARLARNASEVEEFILSCCKPFEKVGKYAVRISAPFSPPVIFKNEIILGAKSLGVFQDIEECHFNALIELQTAQTANEISLPHGLTALKEPNSILLAKEDNFDFNKTQEFFSFSFPANFEDYFFRYKIEKQTEYNHNDNELYFDLDKIPKTAVFRFRNEGDQFTKFGGGTKSLGDFFTDRKISTWERNRILVCANGNNILFVAGIQISDNIKITKETKNIIKISKEKL